MIAPEIFDYYREGREEHRLTRSLGRLEWIRTWEILERLLPPPSRALDIGGGTGVYALALAGRGYQVHLVDAMPLHVRPAIAMSQGSATLEGATIADARNLPVPDATFAVTLLFRPLYHLTDRNDGPPGIATT